MGCTLKAEPSKHTHKAVPGERMNRRLTAQEVNRQRWRLHIVLVGLSDRTRRWRNLLVNFGRELLLVMLL